MQFLPNKIIFLKFNTILLKLRAKWHKIYVLSNLILLIYILKFFNYIKSQINLNSKLSQHFLNDLFSIFK